MEILIDERRVHRKENPKVIRKLNTHECQDVCYTYDRHGNKLGSVITGTLASNHGYSGGIEYDWEYDEKGQLDFEEAYSSNVSIGGSYLDLRLDSGLEGR